MSVDTYINRGGQTVVRIRGGCTDKIIVVFDKRSRPASTLSSRDLSVLSAMALCAISRVGAGRSPYVGIPVPDRAPFVVERKMLSSLTEGLRLNEVRMEARGDTLALTIGGKREHGSSRYTILDRKLDFHVRREIVDGTHRWASGARTKVRATRMSPEPKAQRLIHRYMKEIERLEHRLVAEHNCNTLGYRLRYCKPGPNPFVRGPVEGDRRWRNDSAYAAWVEQKADRKRISRIAAPFFGHFKTNWAKLYAALRAAGYEVTYTFGRQSGWKRNVSESEYIRQLHYWCGKAKDHPWHTGERSDAEIAAQHMESLKTYVGVLHEKQAIEFEIAALRQLIADIGPDVDAVLTAIAGEEEIDDLH